jgi:hypothetical protein
VNAVLGTVFAILMLLSAALPASADWTENPIIVNPALVRSEADFWYWKLAYTSAIDERYRQSHPVTDFPGTLLLPGRDVSLLHGLDLSVAVSDSYPWSPAERSYIVRLETPDRWTVAEFSGATDRRQYEAGLARFMDRRCNGSGNYCVGTALNIAPDEEPPRAPRPTTRCSMSRRPAASRSSSLT